MAPVASSTWRTIHRFHLHRNLFVLLDIKLLWFGSHTPLVTDPAVPAPIRARHDVVTRISFRLVMPRPSRGTLPFLFIVESCPLDSAGEPDGAVEESALWSTAALLAASSGACRHCLVPVVPRLITFCAV